MSTLSRTVTLLAAAAVGGVATWYMTRPGEAVRPAGADDLPAATSAQLPVPVRLIEVSAMADTSRLRLGGTVEPARQVHLTAQAPGRVSFVAGDEGTKVEAGQPVVALDDGELLARYNAALVDLNNQAQGLQNAQVQLWQNLYGPTTAPMGGAPQAAYEQMTFPAYNMARSFFGMVPGMGGGGPLMTSQQAQRNWATASAAGYDYQRQVAALQTAQARVDELAAQHRDRSAIAPWAGVILKRFVREGDVVQPGQPLADLADLSNLAVRIEVPVAQMADVHLGDRIPITVDGNNAWAPVAQIFPAAAEGAHTVTVKLALPEGAPAAPGMYALAWLARGDGEAALRSSPAIPSEAVTWRGSLPVAFVNLDGRAEMRVLRLGDLQGDRTAVLSGLDLGEKVVIDPPATLKSGDLLEVRP